MKFIKKLLKNTDGFTLIELVIAITVFIIGVVPIYKMIVSGAKVQNVAEETYEATQHSQALLQEVQNQIEIDVGEAYKKSRGDSTAIIKPWLDGGGGGEIIDFLGVSKDKFNEKYDYDNYLYEVHIWDMEERDILDGKISYKKDNVISFVAYKDPSLIPIFKNENTYNFTSVDIAKVEKYFANNESLVWAGLGGIKPVGIGEIVYEHPETIKIRAEGIEGHNIVLDDIARYGTLADNIKLTYKFHGEGSPTTHEIIIEDNTSFQSETEHIVQLSIDLTTFPSGINSKIIRVENRTKATVVIPIYDEKDEAGIQIYPIQKNEDGRIVVENRPKLEPSKNFVIGIIVKDANNIAFGDPNKILSKLVDVYSFDYNKQ